MTKSGDYTEVFTSVDGCESAVNLKLIISDTVRLSVITVDKKISANVIGKSSNENLIFDSSSIQIYNNKQSWSVERFNTLLWDYVVIAQLSGEDTVFCIEHLPDESEYMFRITVSNDTVRLVIPNTYLSVPLAPQALGGTCYKDETVVL